MPAISQFPFFSPLLIGTLSLLPLLVVGQDTVTEPAKTNQATSGRTAPPPPPSISTAPSVAPLKLDIARRDLKNFLTDENALAPYRTSTGEIGVLREVFMIGSPNVSRAFFWDPLSCRLLGVLDLNAPEPPAPKSPPAPVTDTTEDKKEAPVAEAPSPYPLKAAGAMPLLGSPGASGSPRYFGFRLVGGIPEFLYTYGSLAVEERLWLDDGGKVLKQRFAIPGAQKGFRITVPEDWKKRATVSAGTWKENVLSVPKESVTEIIFSYRLTDLDPEPVDSN